MKKVLVTLVAVATLAAFAGSASAVTCTIDHKPSASLLLPYFQTSLSNAGGTIAPTPFGAGLNGTDTLVTIVNASAADTLAHVQVLNRRSFPVIDFNIALTGFDVVSFPMSGVLTGALPTNPATDGHNECVNSDFRRFVPTALPTSNDSSATTDYGSLPGYPHLFSQSFISSVAAELDGQDDCLAGGIPPNFGANGTDTLVGYVTIDMVNYCSFASPPDAGYYSDDVIGFENSLWGDYTIQSEGTTPTYGNSLVNVEADVHELNGTNAAVDDPLRTFYARYWENHDGSTLQAPNGGNGGAAYFTSIGVTLPMLGDMREPLGVRYGARYLNVSSTTTSFLRAWRAEVSPATVDHSDLGGDPGTGPCTDVEPNVFTVIWDEDETPAQQTGCTFSPCPPGQNFNFPFETQRESITDFASTSAAAAGWIYVDFGAHGTDLDEAWLAYDFSAPGAFANAGIEGVSFDANTCQPAGYTVVPSIPEVPTPANADGNTGSGF